MAFIYIDGVINFRGGDQMSGILVPCVVIEVPEGNLNFNQSGFAQCVTFSAARR